MDSHGLLYAERLSPDRCHQPVLVNQVRAGKFDVMGQLIHDAVLGDGQSFRQEFSHQEVLEALLHRPGSQQLWLWSLRSHHGGS